MQIRVALELAECNHCWAMKHFRKVPVRYLLSGKKGALILRGRFGSFCQIFLRVCPALFRIQFNVLPGRSRSVDVQP